MMGLEARVHGKVVGASRCGPASDLRRWEPEPGHPAAEIIIGWGGRGGNWDARPHWPLQPPHPNPTPLVLFPPQTRSPLTAHACPLEKDSSRSRWAPPTPTPTLSPCRPSIQTTLSNLGWTGNRQHHDNKEGCVGASTTVLIVGTSSEEMGNGQ